MKKLIFGSTALKFWYPEVREPKDLDYISKEKSTKGEEHHWVDALLYVIENNKHDTYVDPDFLYTIKASHASWDIKWEKTIYDIMFLKSKGCKLDEKLYGMLYKEWEIIHGKKKINFNKDVEEFFKDKVTRKFNHDELHELLKFGDEPMHDKLRVDKSKALCSKSIWESFSEEDKVKCALEEIYVIATERYVINGINPKIAKRRATKDLITRLSKGFFNTFLIDNYEKIVYNEDTIWLKKLKTLL